MSLHKVSELPVMNPLLSFALELAEHSREILCKRFCQYAEISHPQVEYKCDGSPVTAIDREVELALELKIKEKGLGHSILGEELNHQLSHDKKSAEYLWVIDPLDGTKSFISGNPLFGTLIALLHQGKPFLGVIDLPLLKQRWWGQRDKPSYHCNASGTYLVRTAECKNLHQAIGRCTTPDMFQGTKEELFTKLKKQLAYFLYGGDCFCYGQLASGLVDLVMESNLANHDFMAIVPIVEGAGGIISDWQGKDLCLDSQGDVLALGDKRIHEAALLALR